MESLKLRLSHDEEILSDAQMEQWMVEDDKFAERVIGWFADKHAEIWDAAGRYIGWEMESET